MKSYYVYRTLFFLIFVLYSNCFFSGAYGAARFVETIKDADVRVSTVPVFNSEQLEKTALVYGYGYKYGNLKELGTLVTWLATQSLDYTIAVPIFAGISSQNIQKFLKEKGFDVQEKLRILFRDLTEDQKKHIVETKKFPEGLMDGRQKLEDEIRAVFEKYIAETKELLEGVSDVFSLNKVFGVIGDSDDIDNLIETVGRSNERLMVRSSGKEDTDKLANAGGNESKANVEPTSKAILEAMRDVVASYFGAKSWRQRLDAGDFSLFDVDQITPVVIQRMIGEKLTNLPKCGVMFTEEAEGSIWRTYTPDEEKKTSGITIIQCAYGHNEAIVTSIIPVDSFYVDKNKQIYPVIRAKTYRMKPKIGATGLELVKNNDGTIVKKSSLNQAAILSLKFFANALEEYYKKPMDVEFVIDETTRTIYIVQARPIVHNSKLPPPSYLVDLDKVPATDKLIGQTIGAGGGAVRVVTKAHELIAKDTIGTALAVYQDPDITKDPGAIVAVVVGKMPPAISYEVTAFRTATKPVMYQQAWQKAEEWAKSGLFFLDTQQGVLVRALDKIKRGEGWIQYPISRFISVSDDFVRGDGLTPEALQRVAGGDDLYQKVIKKVAATRKMPSWKMLIKRIKTEPVEGATEALIELLIFVKKTVDQTKKDVILDEDLIRRSTLLEQNLLFCAEQVKQALEYRPATKEYIKRLFPINFLEGLIYQQPAASDLVDGYSVMTLGFKELSVEQKLMREIHAQAGEDKSEVSVEYKGPLTKGARRRAALAAHMREHQVQYRKITKFALTEELAKTWEQFIKDLMKTKDGALDTAFFMMVARGLGNLDLIPLWLNTSFPKVIADAKGPREAVRTFLREYTSQKTFLTMLGDKKEVIQALNVNSFGNPKVFDTAWRSLNDQLVSYFISEEFTKAFAGANNLAKCATLSVLNKFVDQFDLSIKALTGSIEYTPDHKAKNLKVMLTGYIQILGGLIKVCKFPPPLTYFDREEDRATYRSPEMFAEEMQNFLALPITDTKRALQVTPNVDVSALHLGNPSYYINILKFLKSNPSYEDIFIMTHQSLLTILSMLGKDAGMHEMQRPALVKSIESMMSTMYTGFRSEASLIGVTIEQRGAKILYNNPLRVHSLLFDIAYSPNNKKNVTVTVRFSGENDSDRWYHMRSLVELIGAVCNVTMSDVRPHENGMTFTMAITTVSSLDKLQEYLGELCKFTREHSFNIDALIIDLERFKKIGGFGDFIGQLIQKYGLTALSADRFFYRMILSLNDGDFKKYVAVATELAGMGIVTPNLDIQQEALKISEKIFGKEKNFNRVANKAAELTAKRDTASQTAALFLYSWLVENGLMYYQAIKLAGDCSDSSDGGLQEVLLRTYQNLVEKGFAYEAATNVAARLVASDKIIVSYEALDLYEKLFERRLAYESGEKMAGALIANGNKRMQAVGHDLYTRLIKQGQAYVSAEKIAGELAADSNEKVRILGLDLYAKLIEQGQAYVSAEKIAGKFSADSNENVRLLGLDLYGTLIQKGQAYRAAEKVAGDLVVSSDADQAAAGLWLYEKLLKKGQGLEQAEKILKDLPSSSPQRVTLDSLLDKYRTKPEISPTEKLLKVLNKHRTTSERSSAELLMELNQMVQKYPITPETKPETKQFTIKRGGRAAAERPSGD